MVDMSCNTSINTTLTLESDIDCLVAAMTDILLSLCDYIKG